MTNLFYPLYVSNTGESFFEIRTKGRAFVTAIIYPINFFVHVMPGTARKLQINEKTYQHNISIPRV